MKNITILGASGSIGQQALDIMKDFSSEFSLLGCSLGRDFNVGLQIVKEFKPKYVVLRDESNLEKYRKAHQCEYFVGDDGLLKLSKIKVDVFLNALSGSSGLLPTVKAIEAGSNIALANKETLVMAGHIIMPMVKTCGVNLYPVDSEHSAIWQCLQGENIKSIKRIIITASGGSFRDLSKDELLNVTLEDALKHPNWAMGKKITIDSATMMNKGLEVIEASHLFSLGYDFIDTVMHRESIIHSLVEFTDSSVKAQLGLPDMRVPISYALSYPERLNLHYDSLSLAQFKNLTFSEIDLEKYPCLSLAYFAGRKGGIYPAILNASNEAAVDLFLNKVIPFVDIEKIVKESLEIYGRDSIGTLDEIIEIDLLIKKNINEKYYKEDFVCG